ncbi:hypothetical protein HU200_053456 [Digitaria exilis]|uniref:[RNA-polymerase]-subunit kinase n=1 Tax=Digitaria exilis TaxID=1010633 RepID=A0A835AWP2_9POAL|nr:hypothetical protein HU200_053456 [Digitaria exilis]
MELTGETTLRSNLRHRRRRHRRPLLSEATVRAAMWQLLTCARTMHERGVVHRDIKPGNVVVGEDHRSLKLCDLGLAMDTTSSESPPPHSKRAGTLAYMAPCVLLGKGDCNARVDAWSLGCVMAELVRGRPLFETNVGDDDDGEVGQLWAIYEVHDGGGLREMFHEEVLSKEGFEVLSGLLAFESGDRLTADASLGMPWFDKVGALALPKEEVVVPVVAAAPVAAVVPEKKKRRLAGVVQPPLPKKTAKVF